MNLSRKSFWAARAYMQPIDTDVARSMLCVIVHLWAVQ